MSRKLNRRGVALLIVLLVTALLLALVFEFAYATRISLNNAINFRDSQRAYFLARAGVHIFAKYPDLQKAQEQGKWGDLSPYLGAEDTKVMMKWEDEQGKINVKMIRKPQALSQDLSYPWMVRLFTTVSIDQDILDKIDENKMTFLLPTEMHQVMSDEDFAKIEPFVTTMSSGYDININTASKEVLEAMGVAGAETLVAARGQDPFFFTQVSEANKYIDTSGGHLTCQSTIYKVFSNATVGGYTKKIEAIIQKGNASPLYWRAL